MSAPLMDPAERAQLDQNVAEVSACLDNLIVAFREMRDLMGGDEEAIAVHCATFASCGRNQLAGPLAVALSRLAKAGGVSEDRAAAEVAALQRLTAGDPAVVRAEVVLVAHQRRDFGSCLCGWDELGKSHAKHQVAKLREAGLLADDPPPAPTCPTKTPEEHYLGEFPMTCYNCHMHADA